MSDEPPTPEDEPTPGPYVPPPAPPARSGPPPMPGPYGAYPSGPPGYGPPPGYGQTGYSGPYGYGGAPPRNGFGVASLVLGVIGLVTSFFVLGIVPGVLAIVFGSLGRGRAKRREASNGGMAIAGIVLGVLAVIAGIVFIGVYAYVHQHCVDVDGHLHCNDPSYPKT
ncbi:MAG: DUF4190 domain-containing protein [Mycobacteriales bacterium]